MRTPLIAGNWKMNGTKAMAEALCTGIVDGLVGLNKVEILVCPPYTLLTSVAEIIAKSKCLLGAQDVDMNPNGAFTGQVSVAMLKDAGCQYVILGHSERRALYGESNDCVVNKVAAAIRGELTVILCLGETRQERQQGVTENVIAEQLKVVIDEVGISAFESIVIAYEPVWAIGTGITATPWQAQQVHAFIREQLAERDQKIAKQCRILYGGSMKPENAKVLLMQPDIDGGLIGGASLQAGPFLDICKATTL